MIRIQKFLTGLVALALTGGSLFAQEPAGHSGQKSWLELFQSTGTVGYLLLLVSIAGTALVIEHFTSIRRDKIAPPDLVDEFDALIEAENYQEAIELADDERGYLSNIIGNALRMRHA